MLYDAWQCGGAGRRAAALKSDLCETLLSPKVLQRTGRAAAVLRLGWGVMVRQLLKNAGVLPPRNDIFPSGSSRRGLPDLRHLYNKLITG